ncbi:MAG: hypothetical protein ACXVEF_03055 [Polyangiales bacterium]
MLRRLLFMPTALSLVAFAACSSDKSETPAGPVTDSGPSELCQTPDDANKKVRASARSLVIAPGETRDLRLYIEPDVCDTTPVPIQVDNSGIAKVDGTFTPSLQSAEGVVKVTGVAPGTTKLTATFGPSTVTVDIDVRAKDLPACPAVATGSVGPGGSLKSGAASIALAAGAALATDSIDPLEAASVVDPFDASIGCDAAAKVLDGFTALGPATTFGPSDKKFRRELQFEIPVNPARMPPSATLRHLRMQYTSAALATPRLVAITNPRFEKRGDGWVLRFDAPRLGTYLPVVANVAGTVKKTRRLTHRAVFGFSMGGIGSSMFGMNHHDMFDVVVPLGGPMDAGHFLSYSLKYHFGGFCERKAGDPLPTTPCHADPGKPTEMYQHVQSFEDWWHQNDVDGTGGTFGRGSMVDIFRDVSSAWGDPAFNNMANPHVAIGVDPPAPLQSDPVVDYCGNPEKATVAKTGFYDRRYNPDGKLPVIKFCDGANQPGQAGKWAPGGTKPLEMVLAVDYNGNGTRDEGEPVIVQPYEPFQDLGKDGKADKDEPGYDPITKPDPSGDNYDPQYNPLGTEGNNVYDEGEPFEDVGLDGVACPSGETCKFDVGEGNGKFDMSAGLQSFFARDGRMQIEGYPFAKDPAGGKWTDDALDQLDYYSDGGIRDIFNWGDVGYHYMGAFNAKQRPAVYYNDWEYFPNVKIDSCPSKHNSDCFDPKEVDWKSLPKSVYLRYGDIDASNALVKRGDGQHVGYTDQVFRRIQTGLYYVGSRWPDADKKYAEDPPEVAGGPCHGETGNSCTYHFADSSGRDGPVTVILPPGYRAPENKDVKYPVVYFLHGYGQTPEDLQAFVLLVSPFMGQGLSSRATRLEKMILVFVDGRCRGDAKNPECVQGTFYVDSVRKDGPQMDKYFLDLMKHIDGTYRTMPQTSVEVTE